MADRELFFFFDTNAAIYDAHLFRKRGGPQLLSLIRKKKARLVIPDVLRDEYRNHFEIVSEKARAAADSAMTTLETIWGRRLRELLPKERFGEARAIHILDELIDVTYKIPRTDALMIAAGVRAMGAIAPASKTDHGFKDCLIWESLLCLPPGSELVFVSRDGKAFFEDEKLKPDTEGKSKLELQNKLRPELKMEAESKGISITAFNVKQEKGVGAAIQEIQSRFGEVENLTLDRESLDPHPTLADLASDRPAVEAAPTSDVAGNEKTHSDRIDGELEQALHAALLPFVAYEAKALGMVNALNGVEKDAVVDLLVMGGMPAMAAKNSLERLAMAGLIKDTGNNYLPNNDSLTAHAVAAVESEIIKLLQLEE